MLKMYCCFVYNARFSLPVYVNEQYYVDRAIYDGFCLDIAPENTHHLAIFTRPAKFFMSEKDIPSPWKVAVRSIPELQKCFDERPEKYNFIKTTLYAIV